MKEIQPIQVWMNGQIQTVSYLRLRIVADDLISSATFYYELLDSKPDSEGLLLSTTIIDGNVSLNGQDYIDWGESEDINADAYVRVAAKLNLVLI